MRTFPSSTSISRSATKRYVSSAVRTRSFINLDVPKLLDYDSARSKLRKLIEKPSEDPTKLPRVCLSPFFRTSSFEPSCKAQQENDDAREVFELLNEQLIAELPQLLDLRVPYFDPSFEAMIRIQCKFAEDGYEKMSTVQRWVNSVESGPTFVSPIF